MVAITAVKKTVAPMPTYLFCSPLEHSLIKFLSTPEQLIKNFLSTVLYLIYKYNVFKTNLLHKKAG